MLLWHDVIQESHLPLQRLYIKSIYLQVQRKKKINSGQYQKDDVNLYFETVKY